jgi:hypothetical protein
MSVYAKVQCASLSRGLSITLFHCICGICTNKCKGKIDLHTPLGLRNQ